MLIVTSRAPDGSSACSTDCFPPEHCRACSQLTPGSSELSRIPNGISKSKSVDAFSKHRVLRSAAHPPLFSELFEFT